MIRLLAFLNLANMLDGAITLYASWLFGTHIEANPFLRENLVMGILLIKVPAVMLVSWIVWNFDNREPKEKIFIRWVVIALTILLCMVVLFNCALTLSWI